MTNYKSTTTETDRLAADALQDLNIEDDGLSDEYDFMDDVTNGKEPRQRNRPYPQPKRKYMEMLQKVADRDLNQITIELDDLDNVSLRVLMLVFEDNADNILSAQYEKSFGEELGLRLVDSIERNAKHYIDVLSQAVDKVMPKETKEITYVGNLPVAHHHSKA